jgi:esterase/lipase superfamily enzyme
MTSAVKSKDRTFYRASASGQFDLASSEDDSDIVAFARSAPMRAAQLPGPKNFAPPSEDKEKFYRVWYGTNRRPVVETGRVVNYDNNRGEQTSYGICDVHIPKYHKIGSVGSPWWQRLPKFWNDDQILLKRVEQLTEDAFWSSISLFFLNQGETERVLLIYVHGYKTSFQDAAIRTAQLGIDLDVKGAAAFFSWPSKGYLAGYTADEAAIEGSELALGNFILEMANRSGADKVHLIAHSMGNRAVLRAFTQAVGRVAASLKIPFGQVFLAAPDVDVDLFKQLAHVYPALAERTTLYVSQKDKALLSSGVVHDYPRAGYAPPVTVVNDVDTIEVTNIDLTFLGHGYVAEAKPVLTDMHQLMESGTPPTRRFGLMEVLLAGGLRYWRLKP